MPSPSVTSAVNLEPETHHVSHPLEPVGSSMLSSLLPFWYILTHSGSREHWWLYQKIVLTIKLVYQAFLLSYLEGKHYPASPSLRISNSVCKVAYMQRYNEHALIHWLWLIYHCYILCRHLLNNIQGFVPFFIKFRS